MYVEVQRAMFSFLHPHKHVSVGGEVKVGNKLTGPGDDPFTKLLQIPLNQ